MAPAPLRTTRAKRASIGRC